MPDNKNKPESWLETVRRKAQRTLSSPVEFQRDKDWAIAVKQLIALIEKLESEKNEPKPYVFLMLAVIMVESTLLIIAYISPIACS